MCCLNFDRWFITTRFQEINARRVLPCWDEPRLRATFQISIKHHKNHTALSNMPILMQEQLDESDLVWTIFNVTPVMPTYHVAFMVSNDHLISVHPVFNLISNYIEWQRKYWKLIAGYHMKPNFFDTNPITNNWYEHDFSIGQIEFAQIVAEYVSQLFGIEWSATQVNITKITKVDHVIISDLRDNSVQNWGLIFYR